MSGALAVFAPGERFLAVPMGRIHTAAFMSGDLIVVSDCGRLYSASLASRDLDGGRPCPDCLQVPPLDRSQEAPHG